MGREAGDIDRFRHRYARELQRTSRFSAAALEAVMRGQFPTLDAAGLREVMPSVMDLASLIAISLPRAADLVAVGRAVDWEKMGVPTDLDAAASVMRDVLDAVPRDLMAIVSMINQILGTVPKLSGGPGV